MTGQNSRELVLRRRSGDAALGDEQEVAYLLATHLPHASREAAYNAVNDAGIVGLVYGTAFGEREVEAVIVAHKAHQGPDGPHIHVWGHVGDGMSEFVGGFADAIGDKDVAEYATNTRTGTECLARTVEWV